MYPLRMRIALGLALVGILTIAVGWYSVRSSESVPGQWMPVNAPLARALESLNAKEPSVHGSVSPTRQPTVDSVRDGVTHSAAPTPVTPSAEEQPKQSTPTTTPEPRLDLNEATLTQLENLPGIGPSKAKAIITYREKHGSFRSIDELLEVKGIGPKMLEKLFAEVYVP